MTNVEWIAAAIIGILSIARTARLLIHDDFPPVTWVRRRWFVLVGDSAWGELAKCQFCLTPYLAAGMGAWAYWSDFGWTWWVVNGWWAASYVAAMVVSRDQPE